jgi:hypothetical protein
MCILPGSCGRRFAVRDQGVADVVTSDPVDAVVEAEATGETAAIFADIRETLGVDVVNLVWRHLAIFPGALVLVWQAAKPLYRGPAIEAATALRSQLARPRLPMFSADTLMAAGIDREALASIGTILDSYHHTNALALVVLSAFLARADQSSLPAETPAQVGAAPIQASRGTLPRLTPLAELPEPVVRLVAELNRFGEDTDFTMVASMYRHLSHWLPCLTLLRTLLVPLHESGQLLALVQATRVQGSRAGETLAPLLPPIGGGPVARAAATRAVRRFVDHPIARMTALCALMRDATPPP